MANSYFIGDIAESISDTFDKNKFDDVVLINTSDVLDGDVLNHISTPNNNLKGQFKKTFKKGDILYSEIRPGNCHYAYVDFNAEGYVASTKLMVIRGNNECNPKYLYYYLTSQNIINYLQMQAESRSGTFPQITFDEIAALSIPKLEISKQNKIVDIIESFDKKIELNTRINSQICKIRNSYVRNVFNSNNNVDFLEIPITDVAEIQGGYSYKSSEFDDLSNIGMLTIKNFSRDGSFKGDGTKRISPIKAKETQYVNVGDIVVSHTDLTQDADIIGRAVSVMDDCGYDKLIASCDLVKVSCKDKNISNELLAAILSTEHFHSYCRQYINGTTVLHLSKKALPNYKIKIPKDKNLIQEMNSVLVSLNAIQANILKENRTLSELRDTLLPKLMSAEIEV